MRFPIVFLTSLAVLLAACGKSEQPAQQAAAGASTPVAQPAEHDGPVVTGTVLADAPRQLAGNAMLNVACSTYSATATRGRDPNQRYHGEPCAFRCSTTRRLQQHPLVSLDILMITDRPFGRRAPGDAQRQAKPSTCWRRRWRGDAEDPRPS